MAWNCKTRGCVMAKDGLVTLESRHPAAETSERIKAEIEKRGMSIFARVDHAAAARAVGMALRPTEVLMFGNPRAGTPLMQADQTIGIDLPLKFLVSEDEGAGRRERVADLHPGARRGVRPG